MAGRAPTPSLSAQTIGGRRIDYVADLEGLTGTIRVVTTELRGSESTLYAELEPPDGDRFRIHMQGHKVVGNVKESDEVRLVEVTGVRQDGTVEATHLQNVSSGLPVSVWNPPPWKRFTDIAGAFLKSAGPPGVVAAIVAISSNSRGLGAVGELAVLIAVSAAAVGVAAALFFRWYVHPRERSRAFLAAAANPSDPEAAAYQRRAAQRRWASPDFLLLAVAALLSVAAGLLAAAAIRSL